MNVGQLRDMLENYDDDQDVMIAYQPSWPLAAELADVTTLEDLGLPEAELDGLHHGDKPDVVWFVAGGAPYPDPYAPGVVFGDNVW